MTEVKTTERGWGGHFICADRCQFRRNTLVEYKDVKLVVSTVGALMNLKGTAREELGYNKNYQTMAFHSDYDDIEHYDADASRGVDFQSEGIIKGEWNDNKANKMHENVVKEIKEIIKTLTK